MIEEVGMTDHGPSSMFVRPWSMTCPLTPSMPILPSPQLYNFQDLEGPQRCACVHAVCIRVSCLAPFVNSGGRCAPQKGHRIIGDQGHIAPSRMV